MEFKRAHFLQNPIKKWGHGCRVNWAFEPKRKAIIFIHGFNGSPISTWNDLPSLIGNYRELDGCDLFFYGYDSLYTQANNSAITFMTFIEVVTINHDQMMEDFAREKRGINENFDYESIIIIAHSLGAVISRLALNLAYESGKLWLKQVKMILFAPAHHGAHLIPLTAELFYPPVLKPLGLIWRIFTVTMTDLQEKSLTLTNLMEHTKEIQGTGSGDFSKAVSVVWAEKEFVVINNRYLRDAPQSHFNNTNHVSVCKSNNSFRNPIEELIKHL